MDVTSRKAHTDSEQIHYIQGNAKDDHFLKEIIQREYDAIVDLMAYQPEQFVARRDLLLSATKQYVFSAPAASTLIRITLSPKTPRVC